MFRFKKPTKAAEATPFCALAWLVYALSGCGDPSSESVDHGPGSLLRILDVAVEETPADREIEVLFKHTVESVPIGKQPLVGSSTKGSLITRVRPFGISEDPKDFLPAFVVRGEGPKSITVPAEFERSKLTTVVAMVSCYGNGTERARVLLLDADQKETEKSEWIEFERRREPRVLSFDVAQPRLEQASMSGIQLEFEGRGIHGAIVGIELQNGPVGSLVPRVGEAASYSAGDQSRTAAGLVEGAPWSAPFRSTGASRLHLSLYWPNGVRRGGKRPTVVVSAKGPDGDTSVRKRVPSSAESEWHDVEVDLGGIGTGDSTLSVAVEDGDDQRTAAVLVGDAVLVSPQRDVPTVLVITSDTHRADHLGAASSAIRVDTPAIDALAQRGMFFSDCQSTTNVTNPSHIAIMTGIHPRDTQIIDNKTALTSSVATLAEHFQGAGYRTFAAISTQHLGHGQSGLGQGFDRFESTGDFKRRGQEAIRTVERWIKEAKGEPVFAWIHVFDAHAPYEPSAAKVRPYYSGNPRDSRRTMDLDGAAVPSWIQREKITDREYVNALYRGEVDTVDESLRDLLDMERIRNGFVALTADHGESLGTKGIWWNHVGLYMPNLQVPLVLAGPGIEPLRTDAPVQNIDLGRTLLDLAGIEAEFPGRNLVEVARDEPVDEPRFAVAAHGLQASVTSGDWLLVLDLRSYSKPEASEINEKGRVQLFDRRAGVDTEEDLISENFERARRMRAALLDWLGSAEGGGLGSAVALSAAATANLEALGYGGFSDRSEAVWWSEDGVESKWLEPFDN
ncbi:MAG: sulfatase [Planctomycetota bacterium]